MEILTTLGSLGCLVNMSACLQEKGGGGGGGLVRVEKGYFASYNFDPSEYL